MKKQKKKEQNIKAILSLTRKKTKLLNSPLNDDIVRDKASPPKDKLSLWGVDIPSMKKIKSVCREIVDNEFTQSQSSIYFKSPNEDVLSFDDSIYIGNIVKRARLEENSSLKVKGVKITIREIKEDGLVLDIESGRFHSEGIQTAQNTVLDLGAQVIFLQLSKKEISAKVMNCSEKLKVSSENAHDKRSMN